MRKKVEKMFHVVHKVGMHACYTKQNINLACNINDNHMMHVSEISSTTDKIICHFGLFFALLSLKIPKKQNLKN